MLEAVSRPSSKRSKLRAGARVHIEEQLEAMDERVPVKSAQEFFSSREELQRAIWTAYRKATLMSDGRYYDQRTDLEESEQEDSAPEYLFRSILNFFLQKAEYPEFPEYESYESDEDVRHYQNYCEIIRQNEKQELALFLHEMRPVLESKSEYREDCVDLLLEMGEIRHIKEFCDQQTFSFAERSHALRAFFARKGRGYASMGEFVKALNDLEGELGVPFNWSDPAIEDEVVVFYRALLDNAQYQPSLWDRFIAFIEYTGIDPAKWAVPYEGLREILHVLLDRYVTQGDIQRLESVSDYTGESIDERQRERLLYNGFQNLFRHRYPHREISIEDAEFLKKKFAEDLTYFFAHGGEEVPLEDRHQVISDHLMHTFQALHYDYGLGALLRCEELLQEAADSFDDLPECFTEEVQTVVKEALNIQRFKYVTHHAEREEIIARLEVHTGVTAEKMSPARQRLVIFGIEAMVQREARGEISTYLETVIPVVFPEGPTEELMRTGQTVIDRLGGYDENTEFPEQVQAFRKAGIAEDASRWVMMKWLGSQIQARGLSFDVIEASDRLRILTSLNFGTDIRAHLELLQRDPGLLHPTEAPQVVKRFEKNLLESYCKSGWLEIKEVFFDDVPPLEEKVRIMRQLIRDVASESYEFAGEVPSGRTHPLHELMQALQSLPIPARRRVDLMEEVYATYVFDRNAFFDVDSLPWPLPPLQINHEAVRKMRFLRTKFFLEGNTCSGTREELEKIFLDNSVVSLPPSQWTKEELAELAHFFHPKLLHELNGPQKTAEQEDALLKARLRHRFVTIVEEHNRAYHEGNEILIVYGEKIKEFCQKDPVFYDAYETWLAFQVEVGVYTVKQARRKPGCEGRPWSDEACQRIIGRAIASGSWPIIEELLAQQTPERKKELDANVRSILKQNFFHYFGPGRQDWLVEAHIYVLSHYRDLVIEEQQRPEFDWEGYHVVIGTIISGMEGNEGQILKTAPGVDIQNAHLQRILAEKVLQSINLRGGLPVGDDIRAHIRWDDPDLKNDIKIIVSGFIPSMFALERLGPNDSMIKSIQEMERLTGYRVTDCSLWPISVGSSCGVIQGNLTHWRAVAFQCGATVKEREEMYAQAQSVLDAYCASARGTPKEYATLSEVHGLIPSKNALLARFQLVFQSGASIADAVELLKICGGSVELTADQIKELRPTTPRNEALIYTVLLPKQGPSRLAAEKAFRERSALADFIPELLAIQSPTKREEFCPYKQGLELLLKRFPLSAMDEQQRKGLLIYIREFGMQYLPELAGTIINLSVSLQNNSSKEDGPALEKLHEILGVRERLPTLEHYLEKIHELLQSIQQAILEDKLLDPAVEKSTLGMELINAVIPHTGSYHTTHDRPQLFATARAYAHTLQLDTWYKPGSKPVMIAEQERGSFDGSISPKERAIRARTEEIEKKQKDETMQRLLSGWDKSAVLLNLEPTGVSRVYWFTFIRDRFEKQKEVLDAKRLSITNTHGITAVTKNIEKIEQKLALLDVLIKKDEDSAEKSPTPADMLEELQSLFLNSAGKVDRVELESQVGDIARAFSIALMRAHSQGHFLEVMIANNEAPPGELLSKDQLIAWEKWFREEYLEHFAGMHPDVDVPLSAATRLLLQKLWRVDGLLADIEKMQKDPSSEPAKHPIIATFAKIKKLEAEKASLEKDQGTGNERALAFWPVKGIGRVLAGDIANACYNSRRVTLATGGEQKITALLMTIPGQTELAGSTLLIDTKTVSGKRALVIRALNPTEAVIRKSLDAKAVVEATIEYAKDVARATATSLNPIQEIRLCYDHKGGHSTNRDEVFRAETELIQAHGWKTGEALENVTETNFNNYRIYFAEATRVVWVMSRS